jgi:hypothetical protein
MSEYLDKKRNEYLKKNTKVIKDVEKKPTKMSRKETMILEGDSYEFFKV